MRRNSRSFIYSHFDESHSLSGLLLKSRLPGKSGSIEYVHDLLGRTTQIKADQFQQTIPQDGFDAAGNILKFESDGIPYRFSYDDHYHLQSEEGHAHHSYRFDSLSNRVEKDGISHAHNSLNQLQFNEKEHFSYDANGNMIKRVRGNEVTNYSYDALDRLVEVNQNGILTRYTYDPFNRRLAAKRENQEDDLYLYQGQEEIGYWSQGKIKELRLIGSGQKMISLELDGIPYVPLHDLSGNISAIQDLDGNLIERYRYTAFGEMSLYDAHGQSLLSSIIKNPWGFSGKCVDNETGFSAFGLRYYDPTIGRWITADPAGFADGPNLYAYVHNSPLLYQDQFGLFKTYGLAGIMGCLSTSAYDAYQNYSQIIMGAIEPPIQHIEIENKLESEYNFRQKKDQAPFEKTNTYSINNLQIIDSDTGSPYNLKNASHIGIAFINGIANTMVDLRNNLGHLARMSSYDIKAVFCPTYGPYQDAKAYWNSQFRFLAYEGVRELHAMWYEFFKNAPLDATFLMIGHSHGCVYIRNALMSFPPELRERIEVLAIAPGGYISPHLCKSVHHYVSTADIVPYIDIAGRMHLKDTVYPLTPLAKGQDHIFTSPTFSKPIQSHIEKYSN